MALPSETTIRPSTQNIAGDLGMFSTAQMTSVGTDNPEVHYAVAKIMGFGEMAKNAIGAGAATAAACALIGGITAVDPTAAGTAALAMATSKIIGGSKVRG